MTFNALMVNKDDEGKTSAEVTRISEDDLPHAEVTVAVEYSTVNYKDGLCIGPGGGLVRKYPHVPGIAFAGTVESSDDDRYKPGDKVVLTGWRVGEAPPGGHAQTARVKADWLGPLPAGLAPRQAMAVGHAGSTARRSEMAGEGAGGLTAAAIRCRRAGQRRSGLDAIAALTGEPEEPFPLWIIRRHRIAIGQEATQPCPTAFDARAFKVKGCFNPVDADRDIKLLGLGGAGQ